MAKLYWAKIYCIVGWYRLENKRKLMGGWRVKKWLTEWDKFLVLIIGGGLRMAGWLEIVRGSGQDILEILVVLSVLGVLDVLGVGDLFCLTSVVFPYTQIDRESRSGVCQVSLCVCLVGLLAWQYSELLSKKVFISRMFLISLTTCIFYVTRPSWSMSSFHYGSVSHCVSQVFRISKRWSFVFFVYSSEYPL